MLHDPTWPLRLLLNYVPKMTDMKLWWTAQAVSWAHVGLLLTPTKTSIQYTAIINGLSLITCCELLCWTCLLWGWLFVCVSPHASTVSKWSKDRKGAAVPYRLVFLPFRSSSPLVSYLAPKNNLRAQQMASASRCYTNSLKLIGSRGHVILVAQTSETVPSSFLSVTLGCYLWLISYQCRSSGLLQTGSTCSAVDCSCFPPWSVPGRTSRAPDSTWDRNGYPLPEYRLGSLPVALQAEFPRPKDPKLRSHWQELDPGTERRDTSVMSL